ncbi:unnamed protein product [Heligmosomoides polygyrus]|uniref:Autophagy-related protein 9 n=1 Tax=Heligmosomoides polygyrus TaxID=6339 RepID=A0A3P7WPV1_HELPZ|nr:unnamed protein product [Heligmosomoides polygyrus]
MAAVFYILVMALPKFSGRSTPGEGYHSPPTSHAVGSSSHDDTGHTPPVMSSSARHNDQRWDHIENLDRSNALLQFFTLVYEYHQGGGFLTIAVKKVFNLVQFVFVVVQKHLHLKVDRDHITPFDLYNRILRFKNYLVALVNTRALPPVFNVPFIGPVPYLPNGLKSNLRRVLFFGSTSPWAGPYLKEEYKDLDNLEVLTRQMEKDVAMYGFLNLIFFPLIFLYQILYSFFTLTELIKRSPDALGMRRYSNYGRYRLRHFNELDHELGTRLNRTNLHANAYLNQFTSVLTEVLAKNIAFMAGAVAGVLAILSAWDEDVLQIEHVLTVISVCGVIMLVCHRLMADENLVWQPEALMTHIASELHYVPSEWKGQAHTEQVRREFEQLFQLKWMFLLQELSSPVLTPFILLFWVRPHCRELVRFFHDNTVRVDGLGDVCSYALMDVARHGDVNWNGAAAQPTAGKLAPALDGKTELSVLQFASNNPEWKGPPATEQFLQRFRAKFEHDFYTAADPAGMRDGQYRSGMPQDSIVGTLLPTLYQTNPEAANSLTRSLQQSGIDLDSVGADMRIKTLFLREMHEESLRRSSAPVMGYGASMATPQAQSVFGVPQLSQMEESVMPESDAHSRLVLRSNLPGTSEEEPELGDDAARRQEDDDDDNEPPPQFMNV